MTDPLSQADSPDFEEERALAAFGSEAASVRRAAAGLTGLAPPTERPSEAAATTSTHAAHDSDVAGEMPARVSWWRQPSLSIAPLWLAVAAVGGAAAGIGYARYFLPASLGRRTPPAVESRVVAPPPPIRPHVAAAPNQEATPADPAVNAAERLADAQGAQPLPSSAPVVSRLDRERAREQRAIRALLDAYRQAYENRDPSAVAALWPEVDALALERTFTALSHQQVTFDRCEITITDATAVARCDGTRATTRVGDTDSESRPMTWAFALERIGDWRISGVNAR